MQMPDSWAGRGATTIFAVSSLLAACSLDVTGTNGSGAAAATSSTAASGGAGGEGGGFNPSTTTGGGSTATGAGGDGGEGGGGSGGAGGGAILPCTGAGEIKGGPENHCYKYVTTTMLWEPARMACNDWGGDLVGISSQLEYAFLITSFSPNETWIGAHASTANGMASSYAWVNGEPWGELGWGATGGLAPWKGGNPAAGEPCVKIKNDQWESKACTENRNYLCERP